MAPRAKPQLGSGVKVWGLEPTGTCMFFPGTAPLQSLSLLMLQRSRCVTRATRKLASHRDRRQTPGVLSNNRDVGVTPTGVPMGPLPQSPGCWVSPGTPNKLLFCPRAHKAPSIGASRVPPPCCNQQQAEQSPACPTSPGAEDQNQEHPYPAAIWPPRTRSWGHCLGTSQPGVLGTLLSSHTSLAEDHSKLPVHFGVSFPLFPFIPGPASPLCAAACAHEQGLSRAPGGCFYPTSRCFPQAGPKDAPEGGRAQGAAPGGADVGTPPLSCSTQIPGISVLVSCSSSSAPPHCPSSEGQGRK